MSIKDTKIIKKDLNDLRDKINNSQDLHKMSNEIIASEKEITFFHAKISKKIILESYLLL